MSILPCSTFFLGNLPNNTFHNFPLPCSGEHAMAICAADFSAAHKHLLAWAGGTESQFVVVGKFIRDSHKK
jgi:hypothetical protein